MNQEPEICECGGTFKWSFYCAADVCDRCGRHKDLARCYCGWAEDGGDGYKQLLDLGEVLEPEDY
jgi:hypothetical protein